MTQPPPTILWFRRDLRLADHGALAAAVASGGPVIPVFIHDASVEEMGAAARMRLGMALEALARDLAARGSQLILRRGAALEVLRALIEETGAGAVHWSRLYDATSIARDTEIKAALKARGLGAESHAGHVLFEPWTVATGQGGPYRVYTPYWKAVRGRDVAGLVAAPEALKAPARWPASDRLDDWQMAAGMNRAAGIVAAHQSPGEAAAQARLAEFFETRVARYKERRDFPAEDATSGLSAHLAWGEIAPARVWHAGWRAMEAGGAGAEHFLKELVWRDFAWHLMYHYPEIDRANWRPEWDGFGWSDDADAPEVLAWKQGRTGVDFVDAAMREMWVTGRMHNRARMIVASYLTKHMLVHWKVGMDWFADCLTDWDPAANAMGWQWVAGSGPDAAPYFRVFNPETQGQKFDPDGLYRRAWIAEAAAAPTATALAFYKAAPRAWGLDVSDPRPTPGVSLAQGRARALAAYEAHRSQT